MKITRINVYMLDIAVPGGPFHFSLGRSIAASDHSFVMIETDEGVSGIGEFAPVTNLYLEQHAAGARAAIAEMAPALIGLDPRKTNEIYRAMDAQLRGHGYAKSPIDMACWDILGKWTGLSVSDLLGGRLGPGVPNFMSVPHREGDALAAALDALRAAGVHHFQLKATGIPGQDVRFIQDASECLKAGEVLVVDANRGWRPDQAIMVFNQIRDLTLWIEQPCSTYAECKAVKPYCPHPMALDECILGGEVLIDAYRDGVMNAVDLKISRMGGISKSKLWRDFCVELGIPVKVTCSWGSDVVNAACAHVNHSTPEPMQFGGADFRLIAETRVSRNDSVILVDDHLLAAPDGPGLGLDIDWAVLGTPIMVFD